MAFYDKVRGSNAVRKIRRNAVREAPKLCGCYLCLPSSYKKRIITDRINKREMQKYL